ncbi:MAG: aryldialkylphosphatase [Naasia sp.]|nr:aryldialkylphosphatase [Naasia sp.]
MNGSIRTVLGDIAGFSGAAYMHEHLILDSPLIADRFPHLLLDDVDAAVEEVAACRDRGAALMVDAMPLAAGRDVVRLAAIASRTGVHVVAATGLHHDRYYGPLHWTNRVGADQLAEEFVADLVDGVDEFDGTSPIVRRTAHRAGIVKVATSGARPDARDLRNLEAAAAASAATGAPVLTHCEGGLGGGAQVERLAAAGVPAPAIILSHVDKAHDLPYLLDLAGTGAVLELDQSLRERTEGAGSSTVRAILTLLDGGHGDRIVVGTDGARRSLWSAYGGEPGLAWLVAELPALLRREGVQEDDLQRIFHDNAARALAWRAVG